MKSVSGLCLSIILVGLLGVASVANAKPVSIEKQQVVVKFERTVKMHDVLLFGEYVIVHDGNLMTQGKPCFFVYTSEKGQPGKLVTTFHCEPVAREQANEFLISYYGGSAGMTTPIVKEIQFAGDKEGHLIKDAHHH